MPEFSPRTFEQILDQMIAYVQENSNITDFSEGSAVRTILEAASLEDDEQYFQMVQILSMFSIFKAKGAKLDARLADFGITRELAKSATGKVRFVDNNLIKNLVAIDAAVSTGSVVLFSSATLPTTGYPYTIRVAEGTSRMFDITVTNNNTGTGTLTTGSPLPYNIVVGDSVGLVTGTVSKVINSGVVIQCPASQSQPAKLYSTFEQAFIEAGNYYSNEVIAKSTVSGSVGNVTSNKVIQFVGNPPFTGAGVSNTTNMGGGRDIEKDDSLVKRAVEKIISLSRGTVLAIKSAAKGVEDTTTGQRVLSANLVEDFVNNEVIVYIDDGTGFVPDYTSLPDSTLSVPLAIGSNLVSLVDGSTFPSSGFILIIDGANSSLKEYVSKPNTNTLFLDLPSTTANLLGSTVFFVERITTSTEASQLRFRINTFPVVRNTEVIYKLQPAGVWTQLTRNIDYVLNKGTGDLLLTTALPAGSSLVINNDYYTNLAATVQKVLEGDPNDEVNYPGVKAAGIILSVEPPVIRRIEVLASITAKTGFVETDLYADVVSRIEQYISSLGLGEDVIVSRIIDAVHDNAGVESVRITTPSNDLVILENELPVPFASNGDTLVQVI